jgi:Tol biopolymer transport system component
VTDEQWKSAWKVFQSGGSLPPEQISAFLNSASGDPEVREAVQAMFDGGKPVESLDRLGQRIGRYVLTGRLGEGGMGEVYAARDLELGRSAAVKFLTGPPSERFIHEAQAASALNHPNIVTIYEVIHTASKLAIAMELVDGRPLRSFCGSPLPVDKVLHLGEQVARALGAAHARGIIHCDIKPENLMVREDGFVKILDFGLARDLGAITSTSVVPAGTLRYMSPEQSRGESPTPASDVFSLGLVLYELAAGTHPFDSGSIFDSLTALNRTEPRAPSAFNAFVTASLDTLILRMLAKDPSLRPQAAEAARMLGAGIGREPVRLPVEEQLERRRDREVGAVRAGSTAKAMRRPWQTLKHVWLPWMLAVLACAAAGALAMANWLRPKPTVPVAVRFSVPWPEGATESVSPASTQAAPSPDGRNLALIAAADGKTALWIRPMNSSSAHRLENTEGAHYPFWSPDSQFVAYFAGDKLRKISVAGGSPQTICDAPRADYEQNGDGGTWNADGVIVFALGTGSPLMRSPASGGPAVPVTALDPSAGETKHIAPEFLPGGRRILYFAASRDPARSAIYVQELGSSQRVLVMRSHFAAAWTPPGYLLFPGGTTLFAQRMDLKTLRPAGEAVPVAEDVTSNEANGRSSFAVSPNGVLTYRQGSLVGVSQPVWYDRSGRRLGAVGKPGDYNSVSLSPDEKRAAFVVRSDGRYETWIMDLDNGALRRATNDASSPYLGPWSPDSERLAINRANTQGIVELTVASGKTALLSSGGCYALDWSPDPNSILCNDGAYHRLSIIPLDPNTQLRTIAESSSVRSQFRFSPDGRVVAYKSSESGNNQIFVAAFPSFSERRQVSVDGGDWPTWRRDGRELFFRTADGTVMSAEVHTEKQLGTGIPKPLFKCPMTPTTASYWPSRDGKRFLILESDQKRPPGEIVVVMNWAADLRRR